MYQLNKVAAIIGQAAENNGWHKRWERLKATGSPAEITDHIVTKTALIGCEVSEAIEELRDGNMNKIYLQDDGKPEGFAVELADVLIRTLDLMYMLGFNAETLVSQKLEYNETRGQMHGGKQV